MRFEISKDELVVPLYLFLPLLPAILVMYSLAVYKTLKETLEDRMCLLPHDEYHLQPLQRPRVFSAGGQKFPEHPGCSADPVYTSRAGCPDCFLPTVMTNFSDELFLPAPDATEVNPRGPRGFFHPSSTRHQELVDTALLVPQAVCVDTCPFLVALVLSSEEDRLMRNSIRKTWASVGKTLYWPTRGEINAKVGVIFVVTKDAGQRAYMWKNIRQEADLYDDILYLDIDSTFDTLSLKVASALRWSVRHCRRSKFFLKIEQDTFLNVPLLVDLLVYHEHRLTRSVVGHVYTRYRQVNRTGPWRVSREEFLMDEYPVYVSGTAYVLSRKAASRLLALFPFYPNPGREDAFFTGILGRGAGLQHFSPAHRAFFAASDTPVSAWCKFLTDGLVTGTGLSTGNHHHVVWSGVISNDWQCHTHGMADLTRTCWEEFANS